MPEPPSPDVLRALFDQVSALPAHARAAWLQRHVRDAAQRATLVRLLDADASTGYLDTPAGDHAARLATEAEEVRPDSLIGQSIGGFKLLRLLGQGGMAAVFLGEREDADFTQRCAIKLLRRGLYSAVEQQLFQRERRVLAALEHPNIARLVDGGVTTAGIPYLAMEYIDGIPIIEYAARERLNLRARVSLLLTATEAVEAAHRTLVVHRDIKPSNLLVTTDGTVKLLDFGIAKLLDDDVDDATRTLGMFTPGYAAPEQLVGAAVSTATDVYALGVVLHELLLGVRPKPGAAGRPSSVAAQLAGLPDGVTARQLRGDLDNIMRKAMESTATRRYAGAGALADDLDRYLHGRPVAAHPPSRRYRIGKFVQRNRLAVLASGAFAIAIVAALGLALWQAQAAREQARIAVLQSQRANEVRDFLVDIFDDASSTRAISDRPTVDEIVQSAVARVRSRPMPDATRAELLLMLAKVANSTNDLALAERLAGDALALQRRLPVVDPGALLEAQLVSIEAMRRDRRFADAGRRLEPLLPVLRSVDTPATARGAMAASNVLFLNGRNDEAIAMAKLAAARNARVFGAQSLQARQAAFLPGVALASARRYGEARAALEPAIADWRASGLPPQHDLVNALEALAIANRAEGDYRAAEANVRESLKLVRAAQTEPSAREAVLLTSLGVALVHQERFVEAAAALDQALSINRGIFGPHGSVTGRSHLQRVILDLATRRFDSADADLRRAIRIFEQTGFTRVEQYPRAFFLQAIVNLETGRVAEAEASNQRSMALREQLFGRDHGEVASNLTVRAMAKLARQQPAQALEAIESALSMFARHPQSDASEVLRAREQHARILRALGRDREALAEVDAMLLVRRRLPSARLALATDLALRSDLLERLDRRRDAYRAASEARALDVDRSLLPPDVGSWLYGNRSD